ncbi:MAG: tRNA (adenosine(37)-N6)-threonylcarbamoyltransferase complex ATPase subunit type 1 TsaE [Erysipelotrichaceae bacterium]|nr:tRNA (adenosine(37)-N6)-threonylcarbamoyltransferase complex ATPase subunit type 1 TsaE [Erysipelotrichaceae bacterium]
MNANLSICSLQDTRALGFKIGQFVKEGTVITLSGDLGAGKTTLTQSIAKGLGITKTVSSPTFTICKIYHGRLPLYHFDAYRLEGSDEELGFEEMIEGDGLAVIEWPQYIESMIPEDVLNISIHLTGEETREFYFEACGEKSIALLKEIL